ncbi:MAG: NADH-quinone oxidoreductase subunit J [Verrucomicrobiales bacterium]|nr:NADH-quinone oxidoreductase subunit J [Verrucomicrobiales bacterium]
MGLTFPLLATVTWLAALGAVALRRPVYAALSLVVALLGLAAIFLTLEAQFLGMVQILVYVGAVVVLVVFVIQFTRNDEVPLTGLAFRPVSLGVGIAVLVTGGLIACIAGTPEWAVKPPEGPPPGMRQIGEGLMGVYVPALEAMGVLLTVALIGAVLIAMRGRSTSLH